MKIGIDFGSTYSMVSKYNRITKNVEACVIISVKCRNFSHIGFRIFPWINFFRRYTRNIVCKH